MQKSKINIQDQYLNIARKEKVRVEVSLLTGEKLVGHIRSFDSFCLVVEIDGPHLLYKHAVAKVSFLEPLPGITEEDRP